MNPLCIPVPPNGPCPVFARRPPTVGSTFSGGNRKPLWPPGESNPYTRRYWNLNPARLPIPPGSHVLRTVVSSALSTSTSVPDYLAWVNSRRQLLSSRRLIILRALRRFFFSLLHAPPAKPPLLERIMEYMRLPSLRGIPLPSPTLFFLALFVLACPTKVGFAIASAATNATRPICTTTQSHTSICRIHVVRVGFEPTSS